VPAGALDPEAVVTPSIYVDRIVRARARQYTVQGAR
jgi:3-oxoadipate CoA-transferase alpha subunit